MRKEIEFTPIYRGEVNMTPEKKRAIRKARKRKELINEIVTGLIVVPIMLAIGLGFFFFLLFM